LLTDTGIIQGATCHTHRGPEVGRSALETICSLFQDVFAGHVAAWLRATQRPDHVLRACAGALRAARRMERVNDAWEAEGRPRIRIRIGLNCANVLVGNVGSSARLSYTCLGDGVNVAARLEGINKQFGTTVCISDSIYDQVQAEILVRPLKRVQVKGRKTEFMIYELLALRANEDPELRARDRDEQLSAMTWKASNCFEQGEFDAAASLYREILQVFPNDPVAKAMLRDLSPNLQLEMPNQGFGE
jgi:Adenylate and Guanylate cyclase catalytic domain